MSCSDPIYALDLGINPTTGKKNIKILPRRADYNYRNLCERYGKDTILRLPCGKCTGCIESKTRSWAYRCMLEASEYENNCFITLTYRDQCLPAYGLCKRDLQKFFKRLRKVAPGVRYFACGEYGSNTFRPHYHAILFNYKPDDLKLLAKGKFGGMLYTSNELSKLWPFGISSIGEVTLESCGYVARYCMKKQHLANKYKEFSLMSLKPGIGENYFRTHFRTIYSTDEINFDFGSCLATKPFRYFDKLFERIDPDTLDDIKHERVSKANSIIASRLLEHCFENLEQLDEYVSDIKNNQFERLKRGGDFNG